MSKPGAELALRIALDNLDNLEVELEDTADLDNNEMRWLVQVRAIREQVARVAKALAFAPTKDVSDFTAALAHPEFSHVEWLTIDGTPMMVAYRHDPASSAGKGFLASITRNVQVGQ